DLLGFHLASTRRIARRDSIRLLRYASSSHHPADLRSTCAVCLTRILKRLTQLVRIELRSQGTHVVGVYTGSVDTDMTKNLTSYSVFLLIEETLHDRASARSSCQDGRAVACTSGSEAPLSMAWEPWACLSQWGRLQH